MSEPGIAAVRAKIASLPAQHTFALADLRALYDKAVRAFPVGADVRVETIETGGVPGEQLTPTDHVPATRLIYLHGGGYGIGSPRSHRHLAAAIAKAARAIAIVPEYRLAPESPFPAAVDDALAVYRSVLDSGVAPGCIALAGDSAGGGLVIACLLAAREAGLPMPSTVACLSPWADLAGAGGSYESKAAVDPLVQAEALARYRDAYLAGRDPRTMLASPVHADLRGLPPLLIQVGEDEVLLDDAQALARNAAAAGIDILLDVWPQMIHVWQWYWPMLNEGVTAIAKIGAFVQEHLNTR